MFQAGKALAVIAPEIQGKFVALVEFFCVTAAGNIAPVKVDTACNCLEGIYESERGIGYRYTNDGRQEQKQEAGARLISRCLLWAKEAFYRIENGSLSRKAYYFAIGEDDLAVDKDTPPAIENRNTPFHHGDGIYATHLSMSNALANHVRTKKISIDNVGWNQ